MNLLRETKVCERCMNPITEGDRQIVLEWSDTLLGDFRRRLCANCSIIFEHFIEMSNRKSPRREIA